MNGEILTVPDVKKIAEKEAAGGVFCTGTIAKTDANKANIIIAGEKEATKKAYRAISGYRPAVGDRVLIGKFSGTFVILGKLE